MSFTARCLSYATHTLLGLGLAASSLAHAQTPPNSTQLTVEWSVAVAVDAARAKEYAGVAQAAESALRMMGGGVSVANLVDSLKIDGNRYKMDSKGKLVTVLSTVLPADSATRTSVGLFGGGYPVTERFTEKRGEGDLRVTNVDFKTRVLSYFKAGKMTKREVMSYRTTDSAMLPYVFYRQPLPTAATTVAGTDGISTRIFVFDPSADSVTVAGKAVPALKLTSRSGAKDAGVELWLRKTDGFPMRVRLNLNAKYGAVIDQKLLAFPKGV